MNKLPLVLSVLYITLICFCNGKIAGTETTNGDEVTVIAGANSISGTAPRGFGIHVFSENYYPFNDSGFTDSTIVGAVGTFKFPNLQSGTYNMYCKSDAGDSSLFIQQIKVQPPDRFDTDTVTITTSGSIDGKLIDTLYKPVKGAYAYIRGSSFFARTNDSGKYVINHIPEGMYTVEFTIINRYNGVTKNPPVSVSVNVLAGRATETETVIFK